MELFLCSNKSTFVMQVILWSNAAIIILINQQYKTFTTPIGILIFHILVKKSEYIYIYILIDILYIP